MNEGLTILLFTDAFLLLFVTADIIYRKHLLRADHSRNLVHAGSGVIALLFPVFFNDVLPVAILCTGFLLLLILTKKLGLFGAVNAVSRKTYGSILYPVSVLIAFYVYAQVPDYFKYAPWSFHPIVIYLIPIAIMAFADPAAALAGNFHRNDPSGKTIRGSIAFAIVAFLLSVTFLAIWEQYQTIAGILILSLVVTAGTTAAEYWSKKGWDNLTIPLAAILILYLAI